MWLFVWVDQIEGLDLSGQHKILLGQVMKLTSYFQSVSQDYAMRCMGESWQVLQSTLAFPEVFKDESRFWLREIMHVDGKRILAYAQTLVPQSTFLAFEDAFVNLKNRSIGEMFLYQYQEVQRSSFKFSLLDAQFPLYDQVCAVLGLQSGDLIPARASVFYVEKLPLLIIEFFNLRSAHVSKN